MPWNYKICITESLYCYRHDLPKIWAKAVKTSLPLPADVRRSKHLCLSPANLNWERWLTLQRPLTFGTPYMGMMVRAYHVGNDVIKVASHNAKRSHRNWIVQHVFSCPVLRDPIIIIIIKRDSFPVWPFVCYVTWPLWHHFPRVRPLIRFLLDMSSWPYKVFRYAIVTDLSSVDRISGPPDVLIKRFLFFYICLGFFRSSRI